MHWHQLDFAFSALTLLVGRQEEHPACKNWVVGCWHGYLSGARCRLAYGPADATATHCLLLQKNPDCFLLFWYRLIWVAPEKGPLNGRVWHQLDHMQTICIWLQTDNCTTPHHSIITGQSYINAQMTPCQLCQGTESIDMYVRTHTHTFNGPFSGTTRVSWYQKGKTNLDFTEACFRQWVAVASSGPYASLHLARDRYPCRHPTTQFFTSRMPFLPPNQQRQSTEGN